LRLFDDSLEPLDEETAGAGTDLSLFRLPNPRSYDSMRVLPDAWAFNESGRGLLALEPVDVERLAPAIKLQFVDYAGLEEGLLPTEPSAPVAALPDDEPPAGGSEMDAATADDETDVRNPDDAAATGEAVTDAATPGERATDDAPSDGDATDDGSGSESGDDDPAGASTNPDPAMPEDLDDSDDLSTAAAADEDGAGEGADTISADGGADSQVRSTDDGGCGCRIGKTHGAAPWAALLLALAVASARRRRNALAHD
jgi:MYXO-CTERM domain-containing protein